MYKLQLRVKADRVDQHFILNCYNVRRNTNFVIVSLQLYNFTIHKSNIHVTVSIHNVRIRDAFKCIFIIISTLLCIHTPKITVDLLCLQNQDITLFRLS